MEIQKMTEKQKRKWKGKVQQLDDSQAHWMLYALIDNCTLEEALAIALCTPRY